ncbi:MAG: hypothetical protein QNJ23_11525 [Woeseiaceae bacterium]|nr:hypothetical protein [Woeseiaceae bacterium]
MRILTLLGALALLMTDTTVAAESPCKIEPWQQREQQADIVLYAYLDSVDASDEPGQYLLTFAVAEVAKGEAPETIVLTTRTRAWIEAPVREWLDESRQIFSADVYLLMLRSGQTELGKCDPLTRIRPEA